jgi:hypothetical protein
MALGAGKGVMSRHEVNTRPLSIRQSNALPVLVGHEAGWSVMVCS